MSRQKSSLKYYRYYKKDVKKQRTKKTLMIITGVVSAALIISVVILLLNTTAAQKAGTDGAGQTNMTQVTAVTTPDTEPDLMAIKGVTINGVDVAGMTKEDILSATSGLPDDLLDEKQISISVDGEVTTFSARDIGLSTDYESVVEQALAYGNTGTPEEIEQANEVAVGKGMNFTLSILADREALMAALLPVKEKYDILPVDASAKFMPWGYLADGTAYEPDIQKIIEACADGKKWDRPELVKIPEDQRPNKLRYEYWKNTKYISGYIPTDAYLSRFQYIDGQNGRALELEDTVDQIISQIQSGKYSTVTAKTAVVEPAVKLENVKSNTQLVSSWTSSYSSHNSYGRNWNVAKLSGIINGVTIGTGEEWSINKTAGNRTIKSGWKEAAGIENGGYVLQAGGGVCQISSTLYNAAIRAALEITDATHHSIRSNYIPLGLDATISSGGPDLKIKNTNSTPVYIVSYVNPKDKNVTVEIYGQTVYDSQYGEVILKFSSKDLGTYGTAEMTYIYNTSKCPNDGKEIKPGASYTYAEARLGQKAETYIHLLSLDGKELEVDGFTQFNWKPIKGKTYVNGPDPATVQPTPTPAPASTPEPTPSPVPSEPTPPPEQDPEPEPES